MFLTLVLRTAVANGIIDAVSDSQEGHCWRDWAGIMT